jgi:hypothetical protein
VACDCVKNLCENRTIAVSSNNGSMRNFNSRYTLQSFLGEGNKVNVDSKKIWPAVLCFSLDVCSLYWQVNFAYGYYYWGCITVWNFVKGFGTTVWMDLLADEDFLKEVNEIWSWDNFLACLLCPWVGLAITA